MAKYAAKQMIEPHSESTSVPGRRAEVPREILLEL